MADTSVLFILKLLNPEMYRNTTNHRKKRTKDAVLLSEDEDAQST